MKELQRYKNIHGAKNFAPELYELVKTEDEDGDQVIFFVMECLDSDLADLIALGPDSGLTSDHLTLICYNLLCAIKFLHSANILHRDLKPGNILVNSNCEVKICDFGISRTLPEAHIIKGGGSSKRIRDSILKKKLNDEIEIRKIITKNIAHRNLELEKSGNVEDTRSLSSHVGSRWYRAPEISLLCKRYDTASDMWALGCSIYELMTINGERENIDFEYQSLALFQGECCFPLSPRGKKRAPTTKFNTNDDQVELILSKLGQIKDSDMTFIQNPNTVTYLKKMANFSSQ